MERKAVTQARRNRKLRLQQEDRLRVQFEALLSAYEAASDYAAVEKQARALLAVRKTMKDIYPQNSVRGEQGMDDETQDGNHDDASAGSVATWQAIIERKLDRLAAARRAAGLDQPSQAGGDEEADG
ncbi:hypothetical protein [Asticcacaulis sp. EMRT-3]|uniref:hypothetical protein n=1 Tax=Asticcacaulis sp. EMRT-3 TaxID=3040349 RepID=UPI0024AFC295|nr:hypothetical protein [Asticcacaulis sp. EMRT-3]MDI7775391.1 hypothetical protein [Asticcacaulis sp. EMRT-3]